MSIYKKVKSGRADVNPLEAPAKPTIDFSAGRNNTPEQKGEIQSAMGAPAYTPPGAGKDTSFKQSENSLKAEALMKGNMQRTWGSRTPGRTTVAQTERMRRDQDAAVKLKRDSMWGAKPPKKGYQGFGKGYKTR